jgi:hypothetical protein
VFSLRRFSCWQFGTVEGNSRGNPQPRPARQRLSLVLDAIILNGFSKLEHRLSWNQSFLNEFALATAEKVAERGHGLAVCRCSRWFHPARGSAHRSFDERYERKPDAKGRASFTPLRATTTWWSYTTLRPRKKVLTTFRQITLLRLQCSCPKFANAVANDFGPALVGSRPA